MILVCILLLELFKVLVHYTGLGIPLHVCNTISSDIVFQDAHGFNLEAEAVPEGTYNRKQSGGNTPCRSFSRERKYEQLNVHDCNSL